MDNYQKIKVVGKGTFGQAVLVKNKTDGKQYIMKQINITSMSDREKQEAMNEVNVLSGLKHPNIVQYITSFTAEGRLNIVMEYAECGDIYEKIKLQKGALFPEEQILDWFIQIALAVKYTHDKRILHRDLKTQNIFISKNNTIKLGDFGIARVLKNTMECAKTLVGTPYYLSPELCQEKPYNNKSDIWSLGCVLYEMVTHKHAFEGASMKALVGKILKGSYPPISSRYSSDLRDIIAKMLEKDPRTRPSITSVLKAPFLQARMRQLTAELDPSSPPTPSSQIDAYRQPQEAVKRAPSAAQQDRIDPAILRRKAEVDAIERLKQEKDRMKQEAMSRAKRQQE
ncbi:hypothetical protein AKO1_007845 [Acrasis kona]|uniref:non-specific serine/threonine protein kinase n=1 Tax=Acrasis kona TaxID=1008807 RepID=A0AAW2YP56_9EUKA